MKIGAHVSASGGIDKSIDRAQEIGAEAIQLFISPPQGWRRTNHTDEAISAFKKKISDYEIGPIFFHGIYLINLATEKKENLDKAIDSLIYNMNFAKEIGAQGVIFHVGSHKGAGIDAVIDQIVESLQKILSKSPDNGVWLCMENNAGHGNQIGSNFEELALILDKVADERLKICLDTCHLLASGYDITQQHTLDIVMDNFEKIIGLDKLVAVHANDAKAGLGSKLDRHENIGEGHIGMSGWKTIIAHDAFKKVPFFLEVPGFVDKKGPDLENVQRLQVIRDSLNISSD